MDRDSVTVYLGLGSNLGDREGNLVRALDFLSQKVSIERVSSFYETEPVGYLDQPWFLNAALCALTELGPLELFRFLKKVEDDLGRLPSFPGGPRLIDIDILFYGAEIIQTPELTIPHPRFSERAFVLVPLSEIAPNLADPVSGRTVEELLAEVRVGKVIRRWVGQRGRLIARS